MAVIKLLMCLFVIGCRAQGISKADLFLQQHLPPPTTQPPAVTKNSCVLNDQSKGRCVKPTQCLKTRDEIELSTTGVNRDQTCFYLMLCCPLDQIKVTEVVTAPPAQKKLGCGWSNDGIAFRTNTEGQAGYGEFPWMVALIKKSNDQDDWVQRDYVGGGTLIHPSVVMTAAHKLKPLKFQPSLVICRLGEWDTQITNEQYPHEDQDVKKIIVHENFNSKTNAFNIALLITKSEFDLSYPNTRIACLGRSLPQPGTNCHGMGWGQQLHKLMEYAISLKKVSVPIVDRGDCEISLQQAPVLGPRFRLDRTHMCAGGRRQDTCQGDGGSPLVCKISQPGSDADRFSVYGMAAFGIDCSGNYPGVYVDVTRMIDWISGQFQNEGLDAKTFQE
ncbi:unnamed protein product [Leptosia nina]|uniref:Peptidase S1 domain-containing protein n=1 Tax=Leptosia nina TaxID=320188 RepID=A0AAV1K0D7_9NEOP